MLMNRIVQHFQYLFDVKTIQGVLPKLNATYLFVKEMNTYLSAIRQELALDPSTSATRCLEALVEMLPKKTKAGQEPAKGTTATGEKDNYVVTKDKPQELHGVQHVREMHVILAQVREEIGAKNLEEIVPRIKRLMLMLTQ